MDKQLPLRLLYPRKSFSITIFKRFLLHMDLTKKDTLPSNTIEEHNFPARPLNMDIACVTEAAHNKHRIQEPEILVR